MKRPYLLYLFLLLLFISCEPKSDLQGKVIKIKDGDSIVILDSLNQEHEIRLAFIDAPEHRQEFGTQAKRYLSGLIYNQQVECFIIEPTDRYGRIIGEIVFQDSININQAMLAAGMAWHFDQYPGTYVHERLERKAKTKQLGLWIDDKAVAPWEFRRK